MADFIQSMTGCSREQAEDAARHYGDEIWLAVESLLPKTSVSGDKYIPEKPKIDSELSPEQQDLCRKGRDLQDKVNAVFSVAHSKTQTQPVPLAHEALPVPSVESAATPVPETLHSEPRPDAVAKSPQ